MVAARHFAKDVPSMEQDDLEPVQEDELVSLQGRHFRLPVIEESSEPMITESIPELVPEPVPVPALEPEPVQMPVSIPVVSSPADTAQVVSSPSDTDDQIHDYIDQILRELEASQAKPEPEPEPVSESELRPVPERVDAPELEQSAPQMPSVPQISDDSAHGDSARFWDSPNVELDSQQTDQVEKTADLSAAKESSESELESTAVLDHDAIRRAAEAQEEDDAEDEYVVPHRRERIEVGSGFYVPPNNSMSETGTELATRKPRLSFFARIGEFIARLFHIDD